MLIRTLAQSANQLWDDLNHTIRDRVFRPFESKKSAAAEYEKPVAHAKLRRLYLTDEVNRTLLREFAEHKDSERGAEETGWLLAGIRDNDKATVIATVPAGAKRDAGVAHVLFDGIVQSVAFRIIRQWEPDIKLLGVLHTHPGGMRYPSGGDFDGDSHWILQLPEKEGVFGIGTADVSFGDNNGMSLARQPEKHRQILGKLCLSWYALAEGERRYRALPVDLTIGPDLGGRLRPLWPILEENAEAIERLCLQQKHVRFEVTGNDEPSLAVKIKLSEPKESLCILLNGQGVRYYVVRGNELISVDPETPHIDRGAYLVLAELAAQNG